MDGIPYTINFGTVLAEGDVATVGTLDRQGRLGATPYEVRVTGPYHPPICWRVIKTREWTSVEWRFADGVEGKVLDEHGRRTGPVVLGRLVNADMRSDLRYIGEEPDHG